MALVVPLLLAGPSGAQQPTKPLPTASEEVRFTSGDDVLVGTLVRPVGTEIGAAVALLHGSQPGTRHAYLELARWFAARGVAALAFDRRGEGASAGTPEGLPFAALAGDAVAAVRYLGNRPDVDRRRVGVWGISQGGWLAPLAAAASSDVAFVVTVSGPLVSPGEQMLFLYDNSLRAAGIPEPTVELILHGRRLLWEYLRTGKGYPRAVAAVGRAKAAPGYPGDGAQGALPADPVPLPGWVADPSNAPALFWVRHEAVYDPVPVLERVRVPVLAFFGEEDRIVPVDESVRLIEEIRARGGLDVEMHVLEGADHGLRLIGSPGRPLAPGYQELLERWLHRIVGVG